MIRYATRVRGLICLLGIVVLTACSGTPTVQNIFGGTVPTIYDLTQTPNQYAGKQVTAQGYYLWTPGDPATSVLLPGVNTLDGVRDAKPIYASVRCNDQGECTPSSADDPQIGEPSTGAVWLENFPAEVTESLHRPGDSVWGVVEVTGVFETGGGFGPDGSYRYRMQVESAKPLQRVERIVSAVENQPLGDGKTTIFELDSNPEQFAGQTVTTQGYYFWSPETQGSLVEKVEREQTEDSAAGLAPQAGGITMGLDGFPADLSEQLNVGPNGAFVWGLVEVTGTFETGSFADGRYDKQIKATNVTVLEQQ